MKRTILALVVALASLASVHAAFADDPPPTKDQLDAAKKAFADGKALHDQGKLTEAVDKFKESYRLSKNPLLLYNIGLTLEEAGQKDNALLYYRKFLSDAPATAPQRPDVTSRVKTLESAQLDANLNGTGSAATPTTPTPTPPKQEPVKPGKIKPAGTYSAADFQHQIVDAAPPGKPLDISAFVPEDSGFTVTLYYRGAGEAAFTPKQMKWRYKELVARVPAAKMTGNSIQYYIDVKDQAGNKIGGSGKSTEPNLISIDATAQAHYYNDSPDDNGAATVAQPAHHEDEDPLAAKHADEPAPHPQQPPPPPEEPTNDAGNVLVFGAPGTKKFTYSKWGTTIGAGALIGAGVATYLLAAKQASNLKSDQNSCGTPPCRSFDSYDQDVENTGKRYQLISNITLGVGAVSAVVAGYLWYREHKAPKHTEVNATGKTDSTESSWFIIPTAGEGFAGATAAARF